jgi:hypothetical protein
MPMARRLVCAALLVVLAGAEVSAHETPSPGASVAVSTDFRVPETPVEAVDALMTRLVNKQFDQFSPLICEDWRDELLPVVTPARPFGVIGPMDDRLREAMIVEIWRGWASESSLEGHRATVDLVLQVEIGYDRRAAEEAIKAILVEAGMPGGVDDVDEATHSFLNSQPASMHLDSDVELVNEGGGWQICGAIAGSLQFAQAEWPVYVVRADETPSCDLIDVAELHDLTGMTFSLVDGPDTGCAFNTTESATSPLEPLTVTLAPGSLDLVGAVIPGGQEVSVQGLAGYTYGGGLWVDLGDDLLGVTLGNIQSRDLAPVIAGAVISRATATTGA